MEQYLAKGVPFDAVFGFTETAVLGAKSVIQKHGLRIPDDVALCCMSGTALATLVHPQLTAVEQPIAKMAQEGCRLLLEHLADADKPIEEIALRGYDTPAACLVCFLYGSRVSASAMQL